jgi:hypothetical protein
MGLDIAAFRQLTPAPDAAVDEDGSPVDWDNVKRIYQSTIDWTEGEWPGRTEGVVAGLYRWAEEHRFRAGSYGGYNQWRKHLSLCMTGKQPEAIWEANEPGPFLELIHFADNEGYIGPVVSRKLAADFAEHQAKAEEYAKTINDIGDWWIGRYAEWRKAFEMAADGGVVDFR